MVKDLHRVTGAQLNVSHLILFFSCLDVLFFKGNL